MHVTCPSCKFGGTVRDDQIPPEGKEVFCPSCNVKFRIEKNQSIPNDPHQTRNKSVPSHTADSEYLTVSCPVCGFKGKLRRENVAAGQSKRFTCPSCKNPFTFTPPGADPPAHNNALPTDTSTSAPSSCTSCGARIAHTLPICPSCGEVLTGIKICCPSCESTNVGIRDRNHNDGMSQRQTIIFKPASPAVTGQTDIRIPLSCGNCGKTWMIQPALIQTTGAPPMLSQGED